MCVRVLVGLDLPLSANEIEKRLSAVGVAVHDARLYAKTLVRNKCNTIRKLATIQRSEYAQFNFALGDVGVSMDAIQRWYAELSGTMRCGAVCWF